MMANFHKLILLSTCIFFGLVYTASVNRNSNIMTTVSELNNVVNSINFNTPQHVQKLKNAVDRSYNPGSYVPNTVVNFIVKATPSTANQKHNEIVSAIAATGGACSLLTSQWKILQDGRFYTNFFMGSLKCNNDYSYQLLAGNSQFSQNVAGGNLATIIVDPAFSDEPPTIGTVTPPPAAASCPSIPMRVSVWQGKVNQHTDINGNWQTDPDGSSGAELDLYTYCLKFYPQTSYVTTYGYETIYGWRDAGNTGGPYTRNLITYQCVCDSNSNYYKKKNEAFNQTEIEEKRIKKLDKLREEYERLVGEQALSQGQEITTEEGEVEKRTDFYGQTELDCGVGKNYNWYDDFVADGKLDCRGLNSDSQCSYIRDGGAQGVFYLVDTGIYRAHTEFNSRRGNSEKFQTICVIPGLDDSDPACHEDVQGHGTSLASYLVGDALGISKGSKLISMKAMPDGYDDAVFETAVIKAYSLITEAYTSSWPRKPTIVVSGLTLIFEKAPCGWRTLDDSNPQACGVQLIIEMLNMISKGVVYTSAISNGYRNDRDFGDSDFVDVGFDICRYADFNNIFNAFDPYYYPTFSIRGDETWGTSGIRPFRFASIDQTLQIARARNYQSEGGKTLLQLMASNWGNDDWCLDYAVPGFNLNTRAVIPGMNQGSFEPYCYDNGFFSPWCSPPGLSAPGATFDDGYMKSPFKSSATSWATPIGAAMLMSYMIENWSTLQYLDTTMSQTVRNLVDASLPKDYYGNVQKTTTYDWYNMVTHSGFRDLYNSNFKPIYGDGFEYENYTPYSSQFPSYKVLKMSPIAGSSCKVDWPKTRISVWQGKVNQHTDSNGNWVTDPDGSSGAELDKLQYCRKWYPATSAVKDWSYETIYGWRDAGNTGGPYTRTWWTFECVTPGEPKNRIAKWQGKVNQHTVNGQWSTDSDGVSGAEIDSLTYCRKFYPMTSRVYDYKVETIAGWRDRGNVGGPYTRALTSIVCDTEGGRVNSPQTGTISFILDGLVRAIPNPTTYDNLFYSPWQYRNVDQYYISQEPQGPALVNGAYLMRGSGRSEVYFVDSCGYGLCKRHVTSPSAMSKYGFRDSAVRTVSTYTVDSMTTGAQINY